ncbi:alpha/beta fold hydrolase [Pseudomonas citronellolis]|uniref:alpha/beta fold hydrolase n=1 Tax=Pseudomonas citronellolis TaxID=53408 RepID=UPI0021BF0B55|nr:alpha/beta hydrolase [Pseudomonas citronellolis]UXJ50206.1 alpha/beta hydrolase [Pseudomonas citronellolis]
MSQREIALQEDIPAWAQIALHTRPESFYADSNNVLVHYLAWNPNEYLKPGLVFVHGFRGHAHWWDYIAPLFTDNYRVYALDLSGMGESGWRKHYSPLLYAGDIAAVVKHAGLDSAILVGHSFGGSRVLRACTLIPELLRLAVIVDSAVKFNESIKPPSADRPLGGKTYPTCEAILERFRLLPEQPSLEWARRHIAEKSIRQVHDGWTWSFDPQLPPPEVEQDGAALISEISIPLRMIAGELSSVVPPSRLQRMDQLLRQLPNARAPVVIPGGHHHLMLDQPVALVAALRAILAEF